MTYVLIITVWYWSYAVAITAQEFNSAQSCHTAGEQAKIEMGGLTSSVDYVCVPK